MSFCNPEIPGGTAGSHPILMNKDQIKGGAKSAVGKLERKAGKLVGNDRLQVKGLAKQIAGKTQQRYGDIKEAARAARKKDNR